MSVKNIVVVSHSIDELINVQKGLIERYYDKYGECPDVLSDTLAVLEASRDILHVEVVRSTTKTT